jgi:hypothetical protein
MWDFYLAWCEGAFRERYINVAHILFAKNGIGKALGRSSVDVGPGLEIQQG